MMAKDADTKESLLDTARDRFKLAEDAWRDNRKAALEDMRFRAGDQWPEDAKKNREDRPCLVVDKLNQHIRQVVNDGRQNRPMVKVRPIDDGADKEVAEVFQGIIRHIWDRSNADEAVDSALDSAVTGGFGYFRVLTNYAHEGTFNQEIEVGRIRNSMAVLLDPNAMKADGSDAKWGFVLDEIPKEQYKKQYPKAECTDWAADSEKYSDGWLSDENVRVCEYWYKEETNRTLHLLASGETVDDGLYQRAISEGIQPPAIKESREIPVSKVKWCRLSGAEILEEKEWLGKYIPIIPVYGNEYDIDGKVTYSGLIRAAKDAQRLYNYSRSAYAERVALAPKAPWIAAVGQIEEFPEWETANTENHSVLRYNPQDVNGTPVPPPIRQPASDIPSGFAQDMQISEHDIQTALGMYNASLGAQSNEKSGKAILARQREGDVGTFHYQDNLSRAIRHLGRILVDLIPKIYDTPQVARMLGEDGKSEEAQLDPTRERAVTKAGAKSIYNLNVGTYDVSVSAGPSYTTKRAESAEAMMAMTQAQPQLMQVIGDLMVRAMDWPGAEKMADRLKLMLPPQIQQSEQKHGEQSPEVQQVVAQAQQEIQQREQALQEATQHIEAMAEKLRELEEQSALKAREVEIKAYDAETTRLQVLQTAQAVTADDVQEIVMQMLQQLQTPGQIDSGPPPIPPEMMMQPQPPQGGFFMPEALAQEGQP
jgi:hypothetical protein